MEQVEMSNMYINIGVNNSSEKGTEKTQHLLSRLSWLPCPGNQLCLGKL